VLRELCGLFRPGDGRLIGRPKGARGKSKLDGKEGEIRLLLQRQVFKASIAKIVEVSRTALSFCVTCSASASRRASVTWPISDCWVRAEEKCAVEAGGGEIP
jgi:hypothetical protein